MCMVSWLSSPFLPRCRGLYFFPLRVCTCTALRARRIRQGPTYLCSCARNRLRSWGGFRRRGFILFQPWCHMQRYGRAAGGLDWYSFDFRACWVVCLGHAVASDSRACAGLGHRVVFMVGCERGACIVARVSSSFNCGQIYGTTLRLGDDSVRIRLDWHARPLMCMDLAEAQQAVSFCRVCVRPLRYGRAARGLGSDIFGLVRVVGHVHRAV